MNARRAIGIAALLLVGGTAFVMSFAFVHAVLGWGQP